MEELIKQIVEKVGISEAQAKSAVEIAKEYFKDNAASLGMENFKEKMGEFGKEAKEDIEEFRDKAEGIIGSVKDKFSSFLGGNDEKK